MFVFFFMHVFGIEIGWRFEISEKEKKKFFFDQFFSRMQNFFLIQIQIR